MKIKKEQTAQQAQQLQTAQQAPAPTAQQAPAPAAQQAVQTAQQVQAPVAQQAAQQGGEVADQRPSPFFERFLTDQRAPGAADLSQGVGRPSRRKGAEQEVRQENPDDQLQQTMKHPSDNEETGGFEQIDPMVATKKYPSDHEEESGAS